MAIQIPNLGLGDGETGDNELVIRQKYNANFSDSSHAASHLVGTGAGQVPLAQEIAPMLAAQSSGAISQSTGIDCNNFEVGSKWVITGSGNLNVPPSTGFYISISTYSTQGTKSQIAHGYSAAEMFYRVNTSTSTNAWTPWVKMTTQDTSGNAAVSSIQAGVSAPKIAHKKLTGTFPTAGQVYVTIPHGLSASKILSYSILVKSGNDYFQPNYFEDKFKYDSYFNTTALIVNRLSATSLYSQPLTILITYEV